MLNSMIISLSTDVVQRTMKTQQKQPSLVLLHIPPQSVSRTQLRPSQARPSPFRVRSNVALLAPDTPPLGVPSCPREQATPRASCPTPAGVQVASASEVGLPWITTAARRRLSPQRPRGSPDNVGFVLRLVGRSIRSPFRQAMGRRFGLRFRGTPSGGTQTALLLGQRIQSQPLLLKPLKDSTVRHEHEQE